jgi:prepilin-type N-terminal cleavage/methylation domain-containing protein
MKTVPTELRRAFTLIELLVVIAIIGILAGLMTYLLPGVKEKQIRGRARAEMAMIAAAIKNYKVKKGFYPPDNPANSASSALYYELTGTDMVPGAAGLFGVTGVVNSGVERENFLSGLKPNASKTQPANPNATNLVFAYKGPGPQGADFNPWHYDASDPTHNPDSFDLWIDLLIGGKTVTIGNWND